MPTSTSFSVNSQNGQIILILVLVMTAALVVGLAVIQRSLTDVSSSTKSEQSSRAFSAAEAGIERALRTNSAVTTQPLGNDSSIQQVVVNPIPTGNRAYEPVPPQKTDQGVSQGGLKKEDVAQVWLADPNNNDLVLNDGSPARFYNAPDLFIYWGDAGMTSDRPAIEVNIIYQDAGTLTGGVRTYRSSPHFYDPDSTRQGNNHFANPGACSSFSVDTDLTAGRTFYCQVRIPNLDNSLPGGLTKLVMVRAHLLYNDQPHGFAVAPTAGSLPLQGRLLISTGVSGDIQRTVRVTSTDKVLPRYFDYAIFSLGDIRK